MQAHFREFITQIGKVIFQDLLSQPATTTAHKKSRFAKLRRAAFAVEFQLVLYGLIAVSCKDSNAETHLAAHRADVSYPNSSL
jgi:hypothetical protein